MPSDALSACENERRYRMRLIDADKLKPDAEWNVWENEFTCYSRKQIENAHTVNAIPLETEDGRILAVLCPECGHILFDAMEEHMKTDCAWK